MKRILFAALLASLSLPGMAQSSLKLPSLSPNTKIVQDFATSNIEIAYSRPSMRGRKIFGDLVQYGNVWRTGANAATRIKFGEDVEINGTKIKAGEYALYSIPGKESWEIIFNTGTGNWGSAGYSRENDVLRFNVKPSKMEGECQTFTINITDIGYSSCKLEMMWERTRIVIPILSRNDDAIEKNIDKALNHPTLPYFQVANYYNEKNTRLDVASLYVDKALAEDPKAYYMWYLKARIEKKLGHNDKAIEAAQKSIEAASGSAYEAEYVHNNNKLIDEIKKGPALSTQKKTY
jgi:tetratricopeptide (TPR) repeat protein